MSKLRYKIAVLTTGLALLASTTFAQNLEIYVKRNNDITMVCNKKALEKNYKGDVFYNYRKDNSHWVMDKITYQGNGHYKREFISQISEEEIPTYVKGISSLYYDPDQDEENLVAVWEDNIESKVKEAWIETAKEHVKKLNNS